MNKFLERTWAEINLNAVEHNFKLIRKQVNSSSKLCCVVKADAYGHGAVQLADIYQKLGADYFAVSNIEEGEQLRNAGITLPILILGYTPVKEVKALAENNITQAVLSYDYAESLNNEAVKAKVKVKIHIKLDTGMSRIGFFFQNRQRDISSIDEIEKSCKLPELITEGIFTHFAVADEKNGVDFTKQQFECFKTAIELLEKRGVKFKIHHCDNSAGLLDYPQQQWDMCRPGVILYGMMPSEEVKNKLDFQPVMTLKSVVSLIKIVPENTTISYGRTYRTKSQKTILATVPVGYADGYPRKLSNKGMVIINGKKAPIVGRVCMDQMIVDITDIPDVRAGDEVILIGSQGNESFTADDIAKMTDTINYEITCDINVRVPRVFMYNGKEQSAVTLLNN